jgi:hypothetical protein
MYGTDDSKRTTYDVVVTLLSDDESGIIQLG